MRAFGRRAILQGLAAAPVAGPVAVKAIAADVAASNMALAGAGVLGGTSNSPPYPTATAVGSGPKTFKSFATWFAEFGERNCKNRARYVDRLDPDLVEMRLPLNTKFRMQRERNYKRIVEEQRQQFDEEFLRNGIFKWWP